MDIIRFAGWQRNSLLTLAVISTISWMPSSYARDEVQDFSIEQALTSDEAITLLGDNVKFAFGDQSLGPTARNYGEFRTNKKTNAFGKSDLKACEWAFLSAMVSLRDRAVAEGGNAVINIRSNYKNQVTSSETTFQCGAGNVVAGVALIGNVVKLK